MKQAKNRRVPERLPSISYALAVAADFDGRACRALAALVVAGCDGGRLTGLLVRVKRAARIQHTKKEALALAADLVSVAKRVGRFQADTDFECEDDGWRDWIAKASGIRSFAGGLDRRRGTVLAGAIMGLAKYVADATGSPKHKLLAEVVAGVAPAAFEDPSDYSLRLYLQRHRRLVLAHVQIDSESPVWPLGRRARMSPRQLVIAEKTASRKRR